MFDMNENNEELLEQINDILNEGMKSKTEGTFTDKDGKEYHWTVVTNDEKQILYRDGEDGRVTGDVFDIKYPTRKINKALYKLVSIDSVDGQKLNPPHEVAMYKINHLLSNGIDVFKDRRSKIHEIGNFQLKGNKIIHG